MIYFDNAATTIVKPKSVYTAVSDSIRGHGNPGRSGYSLSLSAAKTVFSARLSTARFFNSRSPECVVFTQSATMSLNIAVKCFSSAESRILISDLEHNSVWRSVYKMKNKAGLYDVFEADLFDDNKTVGNVKSKMTPDTGMIILTHVSNVCGKILPIHKIIQAAKEVNPNVIAVVDAAQSAGILKIDMEKDGIDILCAPAHKGLHGIMGLGFIVFADSFDVSTTETFIDGGTGVNSLNSDMPDELPERYEAGTLNMPAISALGASLEFLSGMGCDKILTAENAIRDRLFKLLSANEKIKVYGGNSAQGYTGPILFNVHGVQSDAVANFLSKREIFVRAGYHCSPLAHKKLGTLDGGGVRVSADFFNTEKEAEIFYKALCEFIK